jgi:DNA-binding transcriptional LysR family regulator
MALNLQQLTTFCAVLNEGSMTAAAEKLFLTQPAISQQIRSLEQDLGVELLVRGTRHVKPTLQGQMLYEYAKKIIQLTSQAQVAIQTMSRSISGRLRVGTLNSIGMALVSPLLGLFLRSHSALQLRLVYGAGLELIDLFEANELDILIMPDTKKEFGRELTNATSKFLFRDDFKMVGSGRDPSLPRQIDFGDLGSRGLAMSTERYPRFETLLKERMAKYPGMNLVPVFETNNVGTLKRVVESGLGWGFMPEHAIQKQLRMGRLVEVTVGDFEYSVDMMFYMRNPDLMESEDLISGADVLYRALQQQAMK